MKFEQHDYWVGSHFLSVLINGDSTGLSDEEEKDLDAWLSDVTAGKAGHWATLDDSDEFGRCEVTGLRGSVEKVAFMEAIP